MSYAQHCKTLGRQQISFNIVRAGVLTAQEHRVLHYISTYSHYCLSLVRDISSALKISDPTVRRAINGLVKKGIITKRYTFYKRMVLRIKSIVEQETANGITFIKDVISKIAKKNQTYRSPVIEHDRSPVIEPNKRIETINIKTNKIDLKKLYKKQNFHEFNRKKNEALNFLYSKMANN